MTNKINGIDVSESVLTATNNDVYYSQKAVDELQNVIKRLQEENEGLKKENEELKKTLQELEDLSLKTYDVADFQMYFDNLGGKNE